MTNSYDLKHLYFDHKPPAFPDRNTTCATKLIWEYLLPAGKPVVHLEPFIPRIHEGDTNPLRTPSAELAASREQGFHDNLRRAKCSGKVDLILYITLREWLNTYDEE